MTCGESDPSVKEVAEPQRSKELGAGATEGGMGETDCPHGAHIWAVAGRLMPTQHEVRSGRHPRESDSFLGGWEAQEGSPEEAQPYSLGVNRSQVARVWREAVGSGWVYPGARNWSFWKE